MVGSANCRGRIGTLIKPKLAWVFVCFHSLLLAFLLKLLARFLAFLAFSWISWQDSWRFLDFLGFLDKILGFSWKVSVLKTLFLRFFSRKNWAFFLKFLARSCKIVHILGALGKNLVKILTKGFRKLQDS